MEKGLTNIAGAILVVGLAAVSVEAWLRSSHAIGHGWGLLGGLAFFGYGWSSGPEEVQVGQATSTY